MVRNLKKIKILLLEDDISYANGFQKILKRIGIKSAIVTHDYNSAIDEFNKSSFDLMIVNVFLGEGQISGDEFVRHTQKKGKKIPLIYITSFFNLESYLAVKDTNPHAFLNKELTQLELQQAIELALIKKEVLPENESKSYFLNEKLFFKFGNLYKAISHKEISYLYSKNKSTYAKVGNRNYPVSSYLKDLEPDLSGYGFIRIHRAYLVNSNCIDHINLKESKVHIGEEILPIGYIYRKSFLEKLRIIN